MVSNSQPLQDRVAVITHSASLMGSAIRAALENAGARVVASDAQEFASEQDIATLIERAAATLGRVDIMVNTNVITPGAPAETMPLTMFEQGIVANLTAAFFGCQFAAQQMRKQSPAGGCIINLSSVAGEMALPGHAAFCAAMAGINVMSQTLAIEWQRYDIRVVGVGAGVDDELAATLTLCPTLPDGKTFSHRRIPPHTITTPDQIAQAVVYLASDAAQHINGTTIYVDRGWLADGYWE
jgi:NAD(P)-dependent dehydrogenase (short-subunit alcohol dehydrogenase family)